MSNSEKWKEESAAAVSSLSSTMVSSTATGFRDVAKASSGVTYIIIKDFHFAESPEAVSDSSYEELEARVRNLEAQIAELPEPKTQAFKCKENFQREWQTATTKLQKWHCLMTYGWCLAHGFNLYFPLVG